MAREFRLTPAAERDLEGIWQYSCELWGVDQAHKYIDLMTQAFQGLADAPMAARACDHIRAGYRYRVVERHVAYFKLAPYGITVVRVLHDRMDAKRHL